MPKPQTRNTFCRICEASCGLVAEVEDNRVLRLAPNKEHHGTLGFSCMKGLHQHKMYVSPDRLRYPLKRVGDSFERISRGRALREISAKVRELRGVSPTASVCMSARQRASASCTRSLPRVSCRGWGHQHARGLSVARVLAGANVNLLASDGPDSVERLSGMAHLSGIPVTLRPAAGPVNAHSWSGC